MNDAIVCKFISNFYKSGPLTHQLFIHTLLLQKFAPIMDWRKKGKVDNTDDTFATIVKISKISKQVW